MSAQKHLKTNFKLVFNAATFIEQPIFFPENQSNQKAIKKNKNWEKQGKQKKKKERKINKTEKNKEQPFT